MKQTIHEQREQLTNEETRLRRKWDRLNEQAAKDQRRVDAICAELRRLDFLELVGKPGAVKVRFRFQSGDRCAVLNDKTGTVLAVRRTLALVDFGAAGASGPSMSGKWDFPLSDLAPTDKPQGEVLNLGDGTQ